jgi:hypothetical protein
VIFLEDRAIWRVLLVSKEARRTESLNHDHFDEVILWRGCTLTYINTLPKFKTIECDSRSLRRNNRFQFWNRFEQISGLYLTNVLPQLNAKTT